MEFTFKNITHQDIIESIKLAYGDRSANKEGYNEFIKKKWEDLDQKNIRAIYESEQVIVRSKIPNNTYFIINDEENHDKNKTTLSILIFSKDNDANNIFKKVIKDMKLKLKERKIKLLLPSNSNIVMYLFDNKANDIVAYNYVIKYKIDTKFNLNKREKYLSLLIFVFAIILSLYNKDIIFVGVKESLIASAFFLVITNILNNINFSKNIIIKKIPELYDLNYEIRNEDLEKFYNDYFSPSVPNTPNIPKTPSVPKTSIK